MSEQGTNTPVLEVTDLSVRLGGHLILEKINLAVFPGTIHALLGPNGAGKTTLIRSLVGTLPHKGTISLSFRGKGGVGYVPQLLEFDHSLPISVADFLAIMLQEKPIFLGSSSALRQKIEQSLKITNSHHLIDRLIGSLSGGELRRVLLAQALIPTPEILILDEPASNIDELGARAFEQTLTDLRKNQNMTILMVGHDLTTMIQIADQVTGINGQISYSGPASDLKKADVLKKIFGVQAFNLGDNQEVIA